MNERWKDLVEKNEDHVLTLTLEQRNAIAQADQYIDQLTWQLNNARVRISELEAEKAAAPGLLAACQEAEQRLVNYLGDATVNALYPLLHAAIARARGQS